MNPHTQLKSIISSSIGRFQSLALEDLEYKASPDKWSKKEILGHLIDSAINNHRRFKQFLHQEHLVFDGYNQDNEVQINDYQNRSFSDIINLWSGMNDQIIQIIKAIPESRLVQKYDQHNYHKIGFKTIPANQPTTIEYLILDYIGHLEHHLAQIIPNYESQQKEY